MVNPIRNEDSGSVGHDFGLSKREIGQLELLDL